MWSLHVPSHATKEFSEIDFILVRNKGISCIEVKGGIADYKDGRYYFESIWTGKYDSRPEGPIQQIAGNKKAIQKKLSDKFPNITPCIAHCAILPECEWRHTQDSFDGEPGLILDCKGVNTEPKWLENFIKKVFKHFKEHPSYKNSRDLSSDELQKIREYLRRNVVGIYPLRRRANDNKSIIFIATQEQLENLESLERNSRVLCLGPAGSGKTLLAKDVAIINKAQGLSTCFLVRNESFALYMREKLSGHNIDVISLEENNSSLKKYECIVVDEGQDMMNIDCISGFEDLLEKPLNESKVFWFMDEINQSHLYEDFDHEWSKYFDNFAHIVLTKNCRNPVEIIKETNKITGTNLKTNINALSLETEYLNIKNDDKKRHAEALNKKISYLIENDIDLEDIAVLTMTNNIDSCLNQVHDHDKIFNDFNHGYDGMNKIKFFDIKSFKGQECQFIIIIDIYSDNNPQNFKNYLYTALTRAQTAAVIIKNKNVNLVDSS